MLRIALVLLAAAACGSCAGRPEPYFIDPPPIPPAARSAGVQAVALCFNPATIDRATLDRKVAEACTDPVFQQRDFLGPCTLASPARATYQCRTVNAGLAAPKQPFSPFP